MSTMKHKVKNLALAPQGRLKIEWAESRMPVLMKLREEGKRTQPLKGMRIAGCLHVTKETAVLVRTLQAAGAEVAWSGCNPLSTQDDIAAALAEEVSIYAWHGMSKEEFYWAIERTLDFKPTLTLDDGADLIFTVHSKFPELAKGIIGGTEETTTGVHRLRAMAERRQAQVPRHRHQRRRDEVGLRQRLRHGPELDRRHHPRDERAARRQGLRRRGLRPLRPRLRDARQGHGRPRGRDRDQADGRAQGRSRRLRSHADG